MITIVSYILGFSGYMSRIPNGNANGQATGHAPWCGDTPSCTAFRWKFRDASYQWSLDLCRADTDNDGQTNGLELGDPCCIWRMGDQPQFSTDVSIPGDPNSRTSRTMPSCDPPSSPLPPTNPPPPPNPPPLPNNPPLLQPTSCDITVIGCGLAGATSVASISYFVHNKSLCIVCPSIYESTSAASGNGWLLVPTVENEEYLLNELAIYASEKSIGFERDHAEQFIKDSKSAVQWLGMWGGKFSNSIRLEPVPAHLDVDIPCSSVQLCCVDNVRNIISYGAFDCPEAKKLYKTSMCCAERDGNLIQQTTWPTYIHLKNRLKDKVMWFSNNKSSNLLILDVIQDFIQHSSARMIQDKVYDIEKYNNYWKIQCVSGLKIYSNTIVFGNGGFGSAATMKELGDLGVSDSKFVHAKNTRILKSLSEKIGWEEDPLNAWFLEFVDEQPKWFLWDKKATVLSNNGSIYDESSSYDERGRIRKKMNITIATLLFENPLSTEYISENQYEQILNSNIQKKCDTRSKRLWRNFLANEYGMGSVVNETECSARVDKTTPINTKTIYQGIIDTISGPKTNKFHEVTSESSVYIIGNAGAPSLLHAYVGPGSTLGNAFVGGFSVGKHFEHRSE